MKKQISIALAALMVLAMLVIVPASASTSNTDENEIQIRSPVINGDNFSDIFQNSPMVQTENDRGYIELGASQFAGFYYEIDEDTSTETVRIYNETTDGKSLVDDRSIEENGLVYNTQIETTNYECEDFDGDYPIMGLFAEKYVPITDDSPDKLSKLIVDNDKDQTLKTGEPVEIGDDYELTATQIDTDGDKVWMEMSKDGEKLDDEIIDVSNGSKTWTYEEDIAGEEDVDVMKVHVSEVFQGQSDSLVTISGVWGISGDNVLEIEDDDTFGNMDVNINDNSLEMKNDDSITLSEDSVQNIAKDMNFKVAETENDELRFYLMSEMTTQGTHEVRGSVTEDADGWNYLNFAGFYYDLESNKGTETLGVNSLDDREIPENELEYTTEIKSVDLEADFGSDYADQYNILSLFGEKYVPLSDDTPDKLAKLVTDSDDKHTIKTGDSVDLGNDYELIPQQIDTEGDKVWLELQKNGNTVDDEIIDVSDGSDTWVYEEDVADEENVDVLRVKIDSVFQGQSDSLAVIEGLWMINGDDVEEIENDDTFGKLEANVDNTKLTMTNDDSINLDKDSTVSIAKDISFKVANNDTLRYYPFISEEISDNTSDTEQDPKDEPDQSETDEPPSEPKDEQDSTNSTDDEENTSDTTDEQEPDENDTSDTTDETGTTDPETGTGEEPGNSEPDNNMPGFEAVFAIAGLLAIAFIVRRK